MRFADTSFWIGVVDRRDWRHPDATALAKDRSPSTTSNHVVGETWTALRRRLGHAVAVAFLDRLGRLDNVDVVHIDEATEADAWRWLRRHDERRYSLVDATSFALMRARRIRDALAFDGDFTAAGFAELRP